VVGDEEPDTPVPGSSYRESDMRTSARWLIVACVVAFLSGCGGSADMKDDPQQEVEDANQAYRSELTRQIEAAHWPPSYVADPEGVYKRSTAPDLMIPDPKAYAAGAVDLFQQCAWSLAWQDAYAAGDTAGKDEAMHELRNPELYAALDPQSAAAVADTLDKADLGNPIGMQAFVEQNCKPLNWLMSQ